MLTPSFDIRQDDEFVILNIRAPYVKISEAEFYICDRDFKFYCKPYFLRLHLPGELVEDGREKATYDLESAMVVVHLPKRNRGEHFENLGMLTTLLSKKTVKPTRMTNRPLIEVVGESPSDSSEGACGAGRSGSPLEQQEEEFDWQTDQQLPQEEEESHLVGVCKYGFASLYHGVFSKLQEEIPSIVDCPQPDHMTARERRLARIAHEEASFDPNHYLADLMDSGQIEGLLKFRPPWKEELEKWEGQKQQIQSGVTTNPLPMEPGEDFFPFTPEEREQLKNLPNKEFLLDEPTQKSLYLGLVDLIFAFAYDYRTTEGEATVESAWTICKLSSTLSWLEAFHGNVEEVAFCSLRRSLCYPLYRHWQLAIAILQDTRDIFHLGRRKLLQCLLAVRQTLNSSEPYYVLNSLFLTDYCIWIQRASSKHIRGVATQLDQVNVDISAIGWDLLELEQAAHLVLVGSSSEEEEEGEEEGEDTSGSESDEEETSGPEEEEEEGGGKEESEVAEKGKGLEKEREPGNPETLPATELATHRLSQATTSDPTQDLSCDMEKLLGPTQMGSHQSRLKPVPLIEEIQLPSDSKESVLRT